jgi:hypothetical protein
MRVSPVSYPETPHTSRRLVTRQLAAAAGYVAGRLYDLTMQDTRPSVDAATMETGNFVAARIDRSRTRLTQVKGAPLDGSTPTYRRDEMQEYLHSERYDDSATVRPQPRATLSLYGTGYRDRPATANSFMCQLGVFDLEDGARLVQGVPYDFEGGPWGGPEYNGMRGSLRELFGDSATATDMEQHARINLGVMETDGSFTQIRPFNHHAFGADLLPILEHVSAPATQARLNFQLYDNRIEQF